MSQSSLFAVLFLVCLFLPVVYGEVFIAPPRPEYNLNDFLNITVSVKELTDSSDLLQIGIVCPNKEVIFYANYIAVKGNAEKKTVASWPVQDVLGECSIRASFGHESASSAKFIVTDNLAVSLNLIQHYFNPGEKLMVKGTAAKVSGKPAEGFSEISIAEFKEVVPVVKGVFSLNYSLPPSMAPGTYELNAYVFEKNVQGQVTNKGVSSDKISVASVPLSLNITLNDETFIPGMNLSGKAVLYDQAGNKINGNISLKIQDSKKKSMYEEVNDGNFEYHFSSFSAPGEWTLEASAAAFREKRFFYVEPYAELESSIQGDRLFIKNIGNILYDNPLEVKFIGSSGEATAIVQVNLKPLEEAEFALTSPSGTYDILVNDRPFSSVSLTGRVAAAVELKKGKGLLEQNPFLSLGLFLGLIVFFILLSAGLSRRNSSRLYPAVVQKKKEHYQNPAEMKHAPALSLSSENILPRSPFITHSGSQKPSSEKYSGVHVYPSRKAESTVVIQGAKQTATVLIIKEKNLAGLKSRLEPVAVSALHDFFFKTASSVISRYHGVYQKLDNSTVLAIFSGATRHFRHEITAVKAAWDIKNEIDAHNRKLKERIEYGFGINSGEILLKTGEILQYASISNTIAVAKRVADKSSLAVLVTSETYRRISGEVKATRAGDITVSAGTIDLYAVNSFSGRDAYKGYVTNIVSKIKSSEQDINRNKQDSTSGIESELGL